MASLRQTLNSSTFVRSLGFSGADDSGSYDHRGKLCMSMSPDDPELDFEQEESSVEETLMKLSLSQSIKKSLGFAPPKKTRRERMLLRIDEYYARATVSYHEHYKKLTLLYWLLHPYWHWWGVVGSYNIVILVLFFERPWSAPLAALMGIINVLVAVVIRNGFFLRVIYELETLFVKGMLFLPIGGKVRDLFVFQVNRALHNIGGIHTGSAIFTVVWLFVYLITQPIQYNEGTLVVGLGRLIVLELLGFALLAMIVIMMIFATPDLRGKHHNLFERTHRFCGWSATGFLLAHAAVSLGNLFPFTPAFGLALAITMMVFYPWFLIRRQSNVRVLKVGDRAIAMAYHPALVLSSPGTLIKLSFNPLWEWHAFAVSGMVPADIREEKNVRDQTSIIARAGDWTGRLIDSQMEHEPKDQLARPLWIHFHTPPGFMFSARGYDEVLFVATGAGIAPILSYLQPEAAYLIKKRNVLWIGNRPRETFGIFADTVFAIPDLVVHDTHSKGRPVVEDLCVETFRSFPNCQAVFVVANSPVTRAIQVACFLQNIPCYGAEWDS